MAIPPTGITPMDWHLGAAAKPLDWSQVLLDADKFQARASLRPDTAATIRAAQHVWLAAQDKPSTAHSRATGGDIDALIAMLVDQATGARRGIDTRDN